MSAVTIQTTLTNSDGSALTNDIDGIVETIKSLVKTYVPGIPVTSIFKGVRTLGDEDAVNIPCLMLQPRSIAVKMPTTGKTTKFYPIDFVFYVGDASAEGASVKATSLSAIFVKLFSNNALNDASGANSAQFRRYTPNWDDSEMTRIEVSPVYKFAKGNGPKYVVVGRFQLKLQITALA